MSVSRLVDLDQRYAETQEPVLLTGVQALVRLPLDQRRRDARAGRRTGTLVSGYPGSPLGGYDLELARQAALLKAHDIVHTPAVNEELAATAVWGSQLASALPEPRYDGVVGLWYGKAPGLDRASDAIRHANLSGVTLHGGAVALVGDDAMAKSSTVPSSSEPTLAALHVPTLCPGNVQEVLDLGLHAVALSRCSGLWAALKIATNVADGFQTVDVAPDRHVSAAVQAQLDGQPYVHVPTMHLVGEPLLALEHSLAYARLDAARAYSRANTLNRILGAADGGRLGLVARGKTFYDLRQALADLGLGDPDLERLGIRLLHVRMPFPLDGETVRDFARGLHEVVVVEEKEPFLERLVKAELFNLAQRPAVLGKQDDEDRPLVTLAGELDADAIAAAIGERIPRLQDVAPVRDRLALLRRRPLPAPLAMARAPYFCSGCPHNTSVTKLPDGAVVGAGIGCHGMATMMREEEVGHVTGLTQMGGEGAQWIGQAPFTGTRHVFQNVGDGTFHHSASLAMRASVAAGSNITYKLLWNSHIAMTGGQAPVPAMSLPDVTRWLAAEGIRRVIVTSDEPARWASARLADGAEVWDRARIVEAQEVLAGIEGTTVLIHDQECAAEQRRQRKRGTLEDPAARIFINERVCEGCGDCGTKSNCLSVHPVESEFGRKTEIHQASCNKDRTCLEGDCPSFMMVTPAVGRPAAATAAPPMEIGGLEDPSPPADLDGGFGIRIAGVGGTGVVTVSQVLATAALLDGHFVTGLDQTGLAQKGGPVVSDLRISAVALEDGANKLGVADCGLYIAADLLTGASAKLLAAADPGRTVAVVSTTRVPTGAMVVDTTAASPDADGLVERILARSDRERSVQLDASALASTLLGTEVVANMLLVGAAYQLGALPVSAAAVERAIELNGASAALNLEAFRRGRQAVAAPEELRAALAAVAPPPAPAPGPSPGETAIAARVAAPAGSELERLVAVRVPELVAYQGAALAKRYAAAVEAARRVEAERVPGRAAFAEAVAFSLHKLMAYKDEYEVARLHLDPRARAAVEAEFGAGARIVYQLHPPLLRAMGLRRKIGLGAWFDPALRTLAGMRRVRGTPLDPFGRAHVRRVERALIDEYRAAVDSASARLTPATHATAVEIARLPDLIRGYEDVKLASVGRYRARLAVLQARLDEELTPIPEKEIA